jgi:RNA polymerase sigma factor (sigma-70 family)
MADTSADATVADVPSSTGGLNWAEIYAEHGRSMRTAATAMLGGPDKEILGKSADDIVGDVLAELMVKDLGHVTNLRSYYTSAVRNRIRDLQRRSKYERPEAIDFDAMVGVEDVEHSIDRAELAGQAMASLDELPERERYALVERIMKCRTAKDVAAELGIKPQQVSQLYNAALGRLRKLPAFTALLPVDRPPPGPSMAPGSDETGTPS